MSIQATFTPIKVVVVTMAKVVATLKADTLSKATTTPPDKDLLPSNVSRPLQLGPSTEPGMAASRREAALLRQDTLGPVTEVGPSPEVVVSSRVGR